MLDAMNEERRINIPKFRLKFLNFLVENARSLRRKHLATIISPNSINHCEDQDQNEALMRPNRLESEALDHLPLPYFPFLTTPRGGGGDSFRSSVSGKGTAFLRSPSECPKLGPDAKTKQTYKVIT